MLGKLERYDDAILCFDEALRIDPQNDVAWFLKAENLLGLKSYQDAIICYDKAISLDPNFINAINNKGYTLIEMNDLKNAALTYEESLSKDTKQVFVKFYLIFLYRDILNEMDRAMELFNSINEQEIQKDENRNFVCRYYLNKAGFELYNQNQGLAKEYLLQAFGVLEKNDATASIANDGWWMRFGYAIDKLGYNSWFLNILEEKGYDTVLSPYYTAIQAIEIEKLDSRSGKKNAELYISNRAIEISEPARKIMERIQKYIQ
jgi:tetratricopeptide (TPR) repeat protein